MTLATELPVQSGLESVPSLAEGNPAGRTVDHLGLVSLALARGSSEVPMADDTASWPFLTLYGLSGQTVVHRSNAGVSIGPGDLTVLSNHRGMRAQSMQLSRLLVVAIPRSAVGPHREELQRADAVRIQTTEGIPLLVGQLLRGLAAQRRDFLLSARLARHVAGLIGVACFEVLDQKGISDRRATIHDAKEYIELHLQDPDLTPAGTAAALFVSMRTLNRIFETEGSTVSGWIRWRRLEQCRLELGDRASDGTPVGQVGAKWGFWDAAHFSRLFRATYGVPPATYRANRLEQVLQTSAI